MAASSSFLPVGRRQAHLSGAQILIAITVLGLGLWGAFTQYAFWPSVVVIALVLGSSILASPSTVVGRVVQLYGASGVWTPLTGFLLAHAVTVSGLGRRLALAVVRRVGRRPSLVVLAVGIATILVAPLSPSTTAKAFLLLLGSAISTTGAFLLVVAVPYWQLLGLFG